MFHLLGKIMSKVMFVDFHNEHKQICLQWLSNAMQKPEAGFITALFIKPRLCVTKTLLIGGCELKASATVG